MSLDVTLLRSALLNDLADACVAAADRMHERAVEMDAKRADTIAGSPSEFAYYQIQHEALSIACGLDAAAKVLRDKAKGHV